MEKTFSIRRVDIKEALDELGKLIERVDQYRNKYPEFSYETKIHKRKKYWVITLIVKKNV